MQESKNKVVTENQEPAKNQNEELIRLDRMYESLRYNDYSIENGLGEIVDNSIEAGASKIAVKIKKGFIQSSKQKKPKEIITEVAIIDDGSGMDQDVIRKCLVLGESIRKLKNGKQGIGRFGVGMTLGGISLARRIEVYSRTSTKAEFLYTFIDLDDIQSGNLINIPTPVAKEPEKEYLDELIDLSGTIIVLTKCDRIIENAGGKSFDANELVKGLANYLGRTYRKFIAAGLNIELDGTKVYLHDPLYLAGPTIFDVKEKGKTDPKAQPWGEDIIELDIPGSNGETAEVVIRMSLLPKEWRMEQGAGGSDAAKKRKIDQNEGISILRADREVLYGHVPYIIGKRGESSAREIDRWWGCEISFPAELDDYFQVKYIKRGAEPVPELRDKIREKISKAVESLRKTVQSDWDKKRSDENQHSGVYDKAEKTMAKVNHVFPASKKGNDMSEAEVDEKLDEIVNTINEGGSTDEERREKKAEIRKKPYSIETVKYPQNILFETEHFLGQILINLNVNHPFYKQVLLPLCGPMGDDDVIAGNEKSRIRDAIALILLSYAKAEAMFPNDESLFENLRYQWSTILATAINSYQED